MYLDNKKVFFSGATGMVGSAILKNIIKTHPGIRIKAVYSKNTKPFIKAKNITYAYGDLRDRDQCRELSKDCDCALLAGAVTVNSLSAYKNPFGLTYDNLSMNHLMLEALCENKADKVICIGSATVYQQHAKPMAEEDLDMNIDPEPAFYSTGWAGRFIEKMCKKWHDLTGKSMVIIRASNVFGPYAKFNPQNSNFIPALIRKAEERIDPFTVMGSPDVCRDVIYSDDFADAVIGLMNKPDIKFDCFNIGAGKPVTVGEVVNEVLSASGHKPSEVNYAGRDKTVSGFRGINTEKIRKAIGWVPARTLKEGISETLKWWSDNKRRWKK